MKDPQSKPAKVIKPSPFMRSDGGGTDSTDAMDSMKEFMMPTKNLASDEKTGAINKPINTNPFHDAGEPSPEQFGMGRGQHGANS
jgi:hypothetical protein